MLLTNFQELTIVKTPILKKLIKSVQKVKDRYLLNVLKDFKRVVQLVHRGEEGQTQQLLVRATFSSFSRPNHLEILVL